MNMVIIGSVYASINIYIVHAHTCFQMFMFESYRKKSDRDARENLHKKCEIKFVLKLSY